MASNKDVVFTPAEEAILITLLYSDIFSFPLTESELWQFLISKRSIAKKAFLSSLKSLKPYILYKEGYYSLQNRENIILRRKKNLPEVKKKLYLAQSVARILARIPTVLCIGISGGLAVGNVTKYDDVDFVIIVKKNTLYVSRLLILGILEMLGKRRARKQKRTADTICVNLLFDETAFSWFESHKDVYTAREIAQFVPLYTTNNVYKRFIKANSWIYSFLPNARKREIQMVKQQKLRLSFIYIVILFMSRMLTNQFFESIFVYLQMSWMKQYKTKEVIKKNILAFHPNDYRIKTLARLKLKSRKFGLLTKF